MKRKIIAAVFTGMLTVALFPAIAHAEIENPEDYMGIWYANYVIYSDESSERHNVAEYLNQYLEMRLMEDGSAYMEMSYNSEEPDSAEILKVSWKLEDGKILVSLEEGDIYLDTVDGEFVGSLDEDTQVIFGRELVQTGESQSLDNLDDLEDSEKARFQRRIPIFIIRKQTIWRRSLPAILGLRIWKKVMKFPWMRTMEPLQLIGQEMNIMIPGTMLEATE